MVCQSVNMLDMFVHIYTRQLANQSGLSWLISFSHETLNMLMTVSIQCLCETVLVFLYRLSLSNCNDSYRCDIFDSLETEASQMLASILLFNTWIFKTETWSNLSYSIKEFKAWRDPWIWNFSDVTVTNSFDLGIGKYY